MVVLVKATENINRGDDGTEVEGDLGQRDNGHRHAHEHSERLWVSWGPEYIGGDGITDTVAKHKDSDDGKTCVQDILRIVSQERAPQGYVDLQLTEKEKVTLTAFPHLYGCRMSR